MKNFRNLKVYEAPGCNKTEVPMITLKGKWVKELGFLVGTPVSVKCEKGKIVITLEEAVSE